MHVFGSKLKLMWKRITLSRLTIIYFLFSLCHCIVQVTFQVQAFSINEQAASLLHSISLQGNATAPNGFFVLTSSGLRLCDEVPSTFDTQTCSVIWNGTNLGNDYASVGSASIPSLAQTANTSASPTSISSPTQLSAPSNGETASATSTASTATSTASSVNHGSVQVKVTINGTTFVEYYKRSSDDDSGTIATSRVDGQTQVQINGLGWDNKTMSLDQTCLWALNYPVEILSNTKREDIAFIAFQFWVLGMSIVALLNESIPHIIASSLTHLLATAGAGYQIFHTANFKASFSKISTNGACQGVNLLPTYWTARGAAEIPSLVLNCIALVVSVFLSWRLLKLFGWMTFKRVGASFTINRIYQLVLILSIVIQLSLFFMVVTVALWIDQLWNGKIARLAKEALVYKVVFIIVLHLMVLWLMTGWFAVRRELRIPMLVFISLSFGYLIGWGAMFANATFRWTFVTWQFFSLIAIASALLTLSAFILGLVCRLNFGKGLLRYLDAHEHIPDEKISDSYLRSTDASDLEKVAFPSITQAIPTFSMAFGSGDDAPPPSQMFAGRQLGPRFFQDSAVPFESPPDSLRSDESSSVHSHGQEPPLTRHSRQSSEDSEGTLSVAGSKRWQIE
ncbi:hypothetical protein FIBSPDRAFT_907362 [Athelia psychrophila]|uniref:Uncharacterized protein n=1 Tax=Athelia psychrophila TaxID=1759441 RepID=A0A166V279_9AGAM|nr:hypothetical protein FIBSPDRAFT_907362 [Fibularhizoctonia sp. CBS 109695]